MKYTATVYIVNKEKYSGDFKGLTAEGAAMKVINNIWVRGYAKGKYYSQDLTLEMGLDEVSELESGESTIFWCENSSGSFVKVTAE